MIERCRDAFPITMMCRLLKVSHSGYYDWRTRRPSNRAQANSRLLRRIHALHAESDGVFGSPRMYDELRYLGETCSLNRAARLMRSARLAGIPARSQWRRRPSGTRPDHVSNHLQRDFTAQQANTKWVTDITYIRTTRLVISGGSDRLVFQPDDWLVDEPTYGKAIGGPGGANGFVAKAVCRQRDFAF